MSYRNLGGALAVGGALVFLFSGPGVVEGDVRKLVIAGLSGVGAIIGALLIFVPNIAESVHELLTKEGHGRS